MNVFSFGALVEARSLNINKSSFLWFWWSCFKSSWHFIL